MLLLFLFRFKVVMVFSKLSLVFSWRSASQDRYPIFAEIQFQAVVVGGGIKEDTFFLLSSRLSFGDS